MPHIAFVTLFYPALNGRVLAYYKLFYLVEESTEMASLDDTDRDWEVVPFPKFNAKQSTRHSLLGKLMYICFNEQDSPSIKADKLAPAVDNFEEKFDTGRI